MNRYRLAMRTSLAGLALLAGSVLAAAAEVEAGLPEKTTAVLTINFKQLVHAPLVMKHGLASLERLCQDAESIRPALEAMGLDPFRDLDRLTLAMLDLGEKAESVLILRGRFDTARFHRAVKNLVKEHGDRFVMHNDDDLKYVSVVSTGRHGSIALGTGVNSKKGAVLNVQTKGSLLDALGNACIALVDKNTLIAASSEKLLKETCKHRADRDASSLNKPMRRLLAELDGKQSILFVSRPEVALVSKSEPTPPLAPRPLSVQIRDPLSSQASEPSSALFPLGSPSINASAPGSTSPVLAEAPSPEKQSEPRKSGFRELSGSINLTEDFKLRCTLRTTGGKQAKEVMDSFNDLRLRMIGLATLLAGSNKNYAFLKEIPNSFLAVRKRQIILVEGHLSAETLAKLVEAFSQPPR